MAMLLKLIFLKNVFSSLQRNPRAKKSSVPNIDIYGTTMSPSDLKSETIPKQILNRKRSEPDIHYGTNTLGELVCIAFNQKKE